MYQVNEGLGGQGRMKPLGWKNLITRFSAIISVHFTKKQLENRRDILRKMYKIDMLQRNKSGACRRKNGSFKVSKADIEDLAKVTTLC